MKFGQYDLYITIMTLDLDKSNLDTGFNLLTL